MNGIIVKAIGGIYYVEASDGIYECKARGVFRRKNISPVGGDRVEFSLEDDGSGVIEKIEERRSLLIRPPLANLDMLVSFRLPANQDLICCCLISLLQ